MWKIHRADFDEHSICKVLEFCDVDIFPVVHDAIKILATLGVSNATVERSFSTLKRLKTWLRNRMSEDRLSALALLHIHRDIALNFDNIINRFANRKREEMNLLFKYYNLLAKDQRSNE